MFFFNINPDGLFFLENFIKKIKKSLFVFVPIIFGLLGIVVFVNSLSTPPGEKGYLVGAFVGVVLIVKIFIISGIQLLSIVKYTVTEIKLTNNKVIFVCSKGLQGQEYNFETTIDKIIINEELNPKKAFKDDKILTFKFDGNKRLYFVPSFWDNQEEIIQLLKPKNE
ncbi:hypothetical protein [Pedobacter sp. UYP1]|uniref:hypothetical protein n=1 Tax=Pedobacter sp. UYP1 TaxID=1756396 RepID=UPI0033992ABE